MSILAVLKTGAAYLPIDPAAAGGADRVHARRCRAGRRDHHRGAGSRLDGSDAAGHRCRRPAIDAQPSAALPAPAPDDLAYMTTPRAPPVCPRGWRSPTTT